ncbi:alpha-taxilin-like isoform X2 [Liolophura sinensis]|uniref:alpha-taxilin-like isoform X2 n=1 Tax=Liolophura sinensis TaxID=3198878 RepID=UPI00315898C4
MADCLVLGPALVSMNSTCNKENGVETTEEPRETDNREGDNSESDQYDFAPEHPTVDSQGFEPREFYTDPQTSGPREHHTEQQTETFIEQQSSEPDHAEPVLTNSEDIFEPREEIFEPLVHNTEEQLFHCEQQSIAFERQRDQQQPQEEEGPKNTEQFHTPPKEQKGERRTTEIMEGEMAVQTQSPIPTMEELKISEPMEDQGQMTMPRVPELSGQGETTQSLEDLSSGGSEGINGSEAGNGISDNDQSTPSSTGNPGGGTTAEITPTTTAAKDSSSKSLGGKSKRKEDKAIEHILKALNSLDTTEEKLAALCKKYADLHEEHRLQQSTFKQTQKKLQVTTREKDQLQSEHNKAVMAKGKLESLCRELQKHNKLIKEESLARAREEEERRKEVSAKFQSTIAEIQTQMQENHERNIKLKEENIELGHKLKSLVEQYEAREEHIEKLMKHKDLENQLHEAKMQQAQCLLAKEQEQNRKEREMVLLTMTETKKKSDLHEAQEKQLRSQLAMYTEKYDDFQSTLNKSNEVLGKFKTEMDKMTKRIKKLEKETAMWRGKWEASNKALLEMAEEKQKHDKEKTVFRAKIDKLESLCRALQDERRGKVTEGVPEVKLEPSVTEKEKTFDPTKTPRTHQTPRLVPVPRLYRVLQVGREMDRQSQEK